MTRTITEIPAASPEQIAFVRNLFAEREIPQAVGFAAEVEATIEAGTFNTAFAGTLIDSLKRLPVRAEVTERRILLDRINTLVKFDQTGRDCEEAMALMARHQVDAEELNARSLVTDRPIYRPIH